MSKRKNEYKPLLFTTTLRNPERIKDFLSIIAKYDKEILTNDLIDKIVFDLISSKIYVPTYVNKNSYLKKQLSFDSPFSKIDTEKIIENSKQEHKEARFDRGWPSRFDTWYKFLKELGLVYYSMNEPIEMSEAGLKLVMANQEGYEHLEEQVFLNCFAKYQRNNPFRRISNRNNPLILLLSTISELQKYYGTSFNGVSIKEIPLFLVWKDDDYKELSKKIILIRKTYGFTPSDDAVYEICKEILGLTNEDEKRFKKSNILKELPDEFIRKMRLTGLISIRGMGRFIDINKTEQSKINYVLSNYSELKSFTSEKDYFDYMKIIDSNLINIKRNIVFSNDESRKLFLHWVDSFDLDTLISEINILIKANAKSTNDTLKYINEPLRLEFITALMLQKQFKNVLVKPNYSFDDEGVPTSFAQGGTPDIECLDENGDVLFEVTLLTGVTQNIREMPAICRHLQERKEKQKNSFSVMIAPYIHNDTLKYAQFAKFKDDLDIVTIDIPTFSQTIKGKENIFEYRS